MKKYISYVKEVNNRIPKAKEAAEPYIRRYEEFIKTIPFSKRKNEPCFFTPWMNEICADIRPNFNKKSAHELCEEMLSNVVNEYCSIKHIEA